jgi:hypothetical protein
MSLKEVVPNAEGAPEDTTGSNAYASIYEGLDKTEPGNWLKIGVEYIKERRVQDIANVRRAVQRYFSQACIRDKYGMVSRVQPVDDYSCIMWVKKTKIEVYEELLPQATLEKLGVS